MTKKEIKIYKLVFESLSVGDDLGTLIIKIKAQLSEEVDTNRYFIVNIFVFNEAYRVIDPMIDIIDISLTKKIK